MKIQESGEMYLETIYILMQEKGIVRSVDIATEMNYSKPSVSRAMGLLKKAALITIDESGFIHFTKRGMTRAKDIFDRHKTITKFLHLSLGVETTLAEEEACRIEHVLSNETFSMMKKFVRRAEESKDSNKTESDNK